LLNHFHFSNSGHGEWEITCPCFSEEYPDRAIIANNMRHRVMLVCGHDMMVDPIPIRESQCEDAIFETFFDCSLISNLTSEKLDDWHKTLWHNEYARLGGKSTKKEYVQHLHKFFELTKEPYIDGNIINDTKAMAYAKWIIYIGGKKEADRYFASVDNIMAYT